MAQLMRVDIIEMMTIDNPLLGDGQFRHEVLTKGPIRAGKIEAQVNLTQLYGGFARFKGTFAQNRTAARFKSLWELSQIGGSRAVDPSREYVDSSGRNPEAIFEIGADARQQFMRAQTFLGPVDFKRCEYVIVGEHGPTAYARFRLRGERPNNGQLTSRFAVEFRCIMDRLAVYWGEQTRSVA